MKNIFFIVLSLIFFSTQNFAQSKNIYKFEFKEIKHTVIKGAPKLSAPEFIVDENGMPITVGKSAYSAPLIYDWDGDGKKDILIGEFGHAKESNIVIHLNKGSNKKPKYSSTSFYAKDKMGEKLYINGY